jgi:hypothetical protein
MNITSHPVEHVHHRHHDHDHNHHHRHSDESDDHGSAGANLSQANKEYFDASAHNYEVRNPGAQELACRLARAMRNAHDFVEDETTVLDFACGTGELDSVRLPVIPFCNIRGYALHVLTPHRCHVTRARAVHEDAHRH